MKKKIFLSVLALSVSLSVFAQEYEPQGPVEFHINFTNFSIGINTPPFALEGSIELLNFGLEHKTSGFGATFSPFNLYGSIVFPKTSGNQVDPNYPGNDPDLGTFFDGGISIINLSAYWNMMSIISQNDVFYIAPFAGLNYLFIGQEIDFTKFIFSAGLQGGIRGGEITKYNIFSIETGFRILNGAAKYFASIKFDFIMGELKKRGILN